MKKRLSGLYAVTPENVHTEALLDMVRQALIGGAATVQYRNKSGDVALQHEQASELLNLCREHDTPFIINDNLRLADLIDADGLHLGSEDAALAEARIVLGPKKIIGVSCYNRVESALEAQQQGADYVAFGSFFTSPTKPHATPAPIALLHAATRLVHLPIVAIGGITLQNAGHLIDAGADAIAVISGLFDAPNIELAAQAFNALFKIESEE